MAKSRLEATQEQEADFLPPPGVKKKYKKNNRWGFAPLHRQANLLSYLVRIESCVLSPTL